MSPLLLALFALLAADPTSPCEIVAGRAADGRAGWNFVCGDYGKPPGVPADVPAAVLPFLKHPDAPHAATPSPAPDADEKPDPDGKFRL